MFRYLKAIRLVPAVIIVVLAAYYCQAQQEDIQWSKNGDSYYTTEENEIVLYTLPARARTVICSRQDLTPPGQTSPLTVERFAFSDDRKKLMIYTNTRRVWRINKRGEYWVIGLVDKSLR